MTQSAVFKDEIKELIRAGQKLPRLINRAQRKTVGLTADEASVLRRHLIDISRRCLTLENELPR